MAIGKNYIIYVACIKFPLHSAAIGYNLGILRSGTSGSESYAHQLYKMMSLVLPSGYANLNFHLCVRSFIAPHFCRN